MQKFEALGWYFRRFHWTFNTNHKFGFNSAEMFFGIRPSSQLQCISKFSPPIRGPTSGSNLKSLKVFNFWTKRGISIGKLAPDVKVKPLIKWISLAGVIVGGCCIGNIEYSIFSNYLPQSETNRKVPAEFIDLLMRGEQLGTVLKVYDESSFEHDVFQFHFDHAMSIAEVYCKWTIEDQETYFRANQNFNFDWILLDDAHKVSKLIHEERLACVSGDKKLKIVIYNSRNSQCVLVERQQNLVHQCRIFWPWFIPQ